jgi:hypothetical protein
MATIRRSKSKQRRSGSTNPAAQAVVLKSERRAPITTKNRRKRVVATRVGKNGNRNAMRDAMRVAMPMNAEAPVAVNEEAPVAVNAEAPVAVAAKRAPGSQGFPLFWPALFFWPALAMTRMWLGPRETTYSSR